MGRKDADFHPAVRVDCVIPDASFVRRAERIVSAAYARSHRGGTGGDEGAVERRCPGLRVGVVVTGVDALQRGDSPISRRCKKPETEPRQGAVCEGFRRWSSTSAVG